MDVRDREADRSSRRGAEAFEASKASQVGELGRPPLGRAVLALAVAVNGGCFELLSQVAEHLQAVVLKSRLDVGDGRV